MIKSFIISDQAAKEIKNAVEWYDEQLYGLGLEFIAKLEVSFITIRKHPDIYKRLNPIVQRCLMERFPYIIFFSNKEKYYNYSPRKT